MDILDINVLEITNQYVRYIDLMEKIQFDLAGEYLVMAAYLTEIKSRMMLPKETDSEEEENDPRSELIRRLQEYERYKKVSKSKSPFLYLAKWSSYKFSLLAKIILDKSILFDLK